MDSTNIELTLESISGHLYEQMRTFAKIEKHLERANVLKMTELNSSGAILDLEGGADGVTDCDFIDAIDMFPILDEAVEDSKRRQANRRRDIRRAENMKRGVA